MAAIHSSIQGSTAENTDLESVTLAIQQLNLQVSQSSNQWVGAAEGHAAALMSPADLEIERLSKECDSVVKELLKRSGDLKGKNTRTNATALPRL